MYPSAELKASQKGLDSLSHRAQLGKVRPVQLNKMENKCHRGDPEPLSRRLGGAGEDYTREERWAAAERRRALGPPSRENG